MKKPILMLSLVAAAMGIGFAGAQDSEMTFFLTSKGPGDGANLGGLEGADEHCSMLAESAGADPDDRAQVALGRQVYAANCASCHGAELEGQPDWKTPLPAGGLPAPPHDDTGHTWHHPDAQLFAITKYGTAALVGGDYRSTMTGFGDVLGDDEIRAVLAYIKSRWPEEIRTRQAEIDARARSAN